MVLHHIIVRDTADKDQFLKDLANAGVNLAEARMPRFTRHGIATVDIAPSAVPSIETIEGVVAVQVDQTRGLPEVGRD